MFRYLRGAVFVFDFVDEAAADFELAACEFLAIAYFAEHQPSAALDKRQRQNQLFPRQTSCFRQESQPRNRHIHQDDLREPRPCFFAQPLHPEVEERLPPHLATPFADGILIEFPQNRNELIAFFLS